MERYDEDLSENSFFQVLQREYVEVFDRAVVSGWIICVPRTGALPKYALAQDDILGHILVPCEELPDTHFRTLTERSVVLNENVLVLENNVSNPLSVHILFDETFYDEDMRKYKVMCLEDPLYASHAFAPSNCTGLVKLYSLRDCIDLLWTEAGGEKALEQLDIIVKQFLRKNQQLEEETLQRLRDFGSELFSEAVQVTLSDPRLGQKTKKDLYLLDAVKLAVETYVLHGIYKKLMKGIAASKAEEDARLNRLIKNLSDLQIIFGPMFSGKTTELIRRLKRYQISTHKCLAVKYAKDIRYDMNGIATYDQQVLPAVRATILKEVKELAEKYSVIGIDEGQFFPDTVEFAEEMANHGKIVIVAALDGTYQRLGFGDILQLVPLAESVVKLTAVCMICYDEASYTKRTSTETAVEVIGGCEKYIATCRKCYFLTSPKKQSHALPLNTIQENMESNDTLNLCKRRLLENREGSCESLSDKENSMM